MQSSPSSSSQASTADSSRRHLAVTASVWLCRLAVGFTFAISGWSKAIDPWGTYYKIGEYLASWSLDIPSELVLTAAFTLGATEMTTGLMLAAGAFRRLSVWIATAFMAVLLPLTVYIAVYNPVADCGCFGDMILLSNTATLLKNVVLTALLVPLLLYNRRVACLWLPVFQWLPLSATIFYAMYLSFAGYMRQPLVDFRPYPVGTQLVDESSEELMLTYTRDGETRTFSAYDMPDSTWTYVGRGDVAAAGNNFAIYSGDDEVTADVLDEGRPTLLVCIPDPEVPAPRTLMLERLNNAMTASGGNMIAVLGGDETTVDRWTDFTRPAYEVFSADDSTIKEIVRGTTGLVMLDADGRIAWKTSIDALDETADAHALSSELSDIADQGKSSKLRLTVSAVYTAILVVCAFPALMLRIVRAFRRMTRRTAAKDKK